MDYTIRIGGEAGQGVQTVGDTLSKVFARAGYHVFTHQDYESRVRGGHNFYQIRLADQPISASLDSVDILVAFDSASILLHGGEISGSGLIIYDSAALTQSLEKPDVLPHLFDVPFSKLATEQAGNKIMANSVAVGAVMGMLGRKSGTQSAALLDIASGIIREAFLPKGEDVAAANVKAVMAGHLFAMNQCENCAFSLAPNAPGKMLISGVEAIAIGALASGCRFYAAYPMTPSTGIMNYLAARESEHHVVVEQAEDEIAAINMALGASFAGVRAMTGTSGGGFALMVEGLSLAGMTETPVVIALGQRPGPATGLPTRTEQGDLQFALYSAHGEFPRLVFAPGTPEQAFHLTNKAFDLAEKYQIPAIIIFDQYLADTCWTYDLLDMKRYVHTDYRLRGETFSSLQDYRRHALTESGISPLGIPGEGRHLVVTDSDEHDEEGHIIEDAALRIKMVDKRLFKKMPQLQQEIAPPVLFGPSDAEIVIAGWGSTLGIMQEAVASFSAETKIAVLHFSELYPFPFTEKFDYLSLLKNAKQTICVEQNATGQFARLLRAETGYAFTDNINRYDGRPFTRESLTGEIRAKIGRL
ncbi:MAG: 2-oxoacid:acceptor oxidoreductase subunit alpha [Thermodesulfovibrio sp.]|nr:2-oxoacid:acceptor oxidoreductase subunit alpha [Thermodesulfovibrio sp.]